MAAVDWLAPTAAGGVCPVGTVLVLLLHPASARAKMVSVAMGRRRLGERFIGQRLKGKAYREVPGKDATLLC